MVPVTSSDSHGHAVCVQLENKNANNNPVPFTAYMARQRTPYQQSKSTTPLYYSWNLAGEMCSDSHATPPFAGVLVYCRIRLPTLTWQNGHKQEALNKVISLSSQRILRNAGVHIIMIGAYELQPQPAPYTSTNMLISPTQIAWITADLAAVDRTVTPWIVAMFHPREHTPLPLRVFPVDYPHPAPQATHTISVRRQAPTIS